MAHEETGESSLIRVEVAFAGPQGQALVALALPAGSTVADAVQASGLVIRFDLFEAALGYGIHGQRARGDTPLATGDRVELLRALMIDPKEARRLRAGAATASPGSGLKRTRMR